MTQSKLERLFEEFCNEYGEDFIVYKLRDIYKDRLNDLQYRLNCRDDAHRVMPETIRVSLSLGMLRDNCKIHQYILDSEHPILPISYDDLARSLRKSFKFQGVMDVAFSDSLTEYESYRKNNAETIKHYQQRLSNKLVAMTNALYTPYNALSDIHRSFHRPK